ncbi:MAG: DNA translocase FtsK [Anaerolineae bacterium]|nr:DNA translocase FtsK [Anaerolineae bacterium]
MRKTQRPSITRRASSVQRFNNGMQRLGNGLVSVVRTVSDPAFWQRAIQKLPPWIDELGAILLVVMGAVMFTALLNTNTETGLSAALRDLLRQIFGYGAFIASLSVLASGVILLLPKFGIRPQLGWGRLVAIEVAFGAFMALLHLIANDPEARALAREGNGGGFLGWALSETTMTLVGHTLSITIWSILLTAGLILASGLRRRHLLAGIAWISYQLQDRMDRLNAMPPESHISFEPEPAIMPEPAAPHPNPDEWQVRTMTPPPAAPVVKPSSPSIPPVTVPAVVAAAPTALALDATKSGAKANGTQIPADVEEPEPAQADEPKQEPPPRPLSKKERQELVAQTRLKLGAANGRSLVAPGEPGERESVVPRDLLPDARVVPAAPRARVHRPKNEPSERYFTVEDFREVKKTGKRDATLPELEMLTDIELNKPTEEEINTNAKIIKHTLLEFDVETEVIDVKVGPTVTQYAVSPYTETVTEDGERILNRVRVSQIANLSNDLALALSAKRLRIQAPVPGHSYVGVEVPNRYPSTVALRPVLESANYYKHRDKPLALPLGRDVSGEPFIADLQTMPHLLIAGTTGSGKSIMLAAMTTAFVLNNTPDKVRLVLLDPKMVELSRFNGLPHLLGPVETELDRIIGVLRWATREMDRRYKLLEKEAARNLETYNKSLGRRRKDEHLPYIVVIIDEIGDLMMQRPDETERTLTRLAQMARAVGIHLMVATQRPSVDVITGLIKANFPARISFAVASGIDSRVILDANGAETLMGRGDMLFLAPDAAGPQRVQGCYVADEEVNAVVDYWREWHQNQFEAGEADARQIAPWERGMTRREVLAETDPMLEDAIELVIDEGEASASLIQRRLGLGYPRAARIIDLLHEIGVIGPPRAGGRSRDVLFKPGEDPFKKLVDKRLNTPK